MSQGNTQSIRRNNRVFFRAIFYKQIYQIFGLSTKLETQIEIRINSTQNSDRRVINNRIVHAIFSSQNIFKEQHQIFLIVLVADFDNGLSQVLIVVQNSIYIWKSLRQYIFVTLQQNSLVNQSTENFIRIDI